MATLPTVGASDGTWGTELNAYLVVGHETDGTHGTKSGFQNRGDPAAADYAVGDLTTDDTWRDLDLGTDVSVPSGAKAVLLAVIIKNGAVGSYVTFRKNGNSNAIAAPILYTQAADADVASSVIVPCDTSQIIEYKASNLTFELLYITVLGWWI